MCCCYMYVQYMYYAFMEVVIKQSLDLVGFITSFGTTSMSPPPPPRFRSFGKFKPLTEVEFSSLQGLSPKVRFRILQ